MALSPKRATIFIVSAVAVIWLVDEVASSLPFAERLLTDDLTDIQAKQIDIYVQVTQQLFTLSTLLLAGVGIFVTPEQRNAIPRSERWPLVLVVVGAAVSMYFGYLSMNASVWMLSKDFFNLQTPVLHYLRLAQFWTFSVSVSLFAWFWTTRTL